jgi:hypothetical protein
VKHTFPFPVLYGGWLVKSSLEKNLTLCQWLGLPILENCFIIKQVMAQGWSGALP